MEQQQSKIDFCGYAIHTEPYQVEQILLQNLIRFQAEGSSRITINGKDYDFHAGDLLVAVPNDSYKLNISDTTDNNAVLSVDYYIFCQWDEWNLSNQGNFPRKLHIGMDDHFLNLFKNLIYERRKLTNPNLRIQDYLVRLLFLSIERFMQNGATVHPKTYLPYQMKNYIEQHASEQITLSQVAAHVGLSISRASKLFYDTFDQSIIRYANKVKLNMARDRILYDGMTLEEIAYSCGFGSYYHFSHLFSTRFGMSPKEYRHNNRNLPKVEIKR